jgi:asparagine synthase (glutamine-hydrolysing)
MCGIYSKFMRSELCQCSIQSSFVQNKYNTCEECKNSLESFYKIKHRGPDDSKYIECRDMNIVSFLGFHRLSIVGLENGMQPFENNNNYLLCNGEIYNYKELIEKYDLFSSLKTKSDCEVILLLYSKIGILQTIKELRGDFAFILYDANNNLVHFGRDPFGVRPLFYLFEHDRNILTLASEAKCFPQKDNLSQVTPRICYTYNLQTTSLTETTYYNFQEDVKLEKNQNNFITLLENSVRKRLNAEREIGFLLSGGLDSSLILSISLKFLDSKYYPIKVFSIGFDDTSPDIIASKEVVNYLKKKYGDTCITHIILKPTIEEALLSLSKVIKTIESFDTTTIRASTPMYLLSKYISEYTNVKVVFSGEGSDENTFLGYLYLLYAPDISSARQESKRLLSDIHYFDGLRADRTTSNFGLELRVPFLDQDFISYCMNDDNLTRQTLESKVEKKYLRDCFKDYLPNQILYRQKNAFSDAVSYDWKKKIKEYTENKIKTKNKYMSSEELFYISEFSKHYNLNLIPYLWLPKWIDTGNEPSATVLSVFKQ